MSADEITRELDELLYALSHDLGAPVRVIDGFSEALLEETSPAEALEYLTTIRGAVSRMNEAVLTQWTCRVSCARFSRLLPSRLQ